MSSKNPLSRTYKVKFLLDSPREFTHLEMQCILESVLLDEHDSEVRKLKIRKVAEKKEQ